MTLNTAVGMAMADVIVPVGSDCRAREPDNKILYRVTDYVTVTTLTNTPRIIRSGAVLICWYLVISPATVDEQDNHKTRQMSGNNREQPRIFVTPSLKYMIAM